MRRCNQRLVLLSIVAFASGCHKRADIRILNETTAPVRIEMALDHGGKTVGDFQPHAWRMQIEAGEAWWSRTADRVDIDNTLRTHASGRTLVRVRRASLYTSGWDAYTIEGRRFVLTLREEDAPDGARISAFLKSEDGEATRAREGMLLDD